MSVQNKTIFKLVSDTKIFASNLFTIYFFTPRAIIHLNLGSIYQAFYFTFPDGNRNIMDLYTYELKCLGTKQNTHSKWVQCFFYCLVWVQFFNCPESQFLFFFLINTIKWLLEGLNENLQVQMFQNMRHKIIFFFCFYDKWFSGLCPTNWQDF